MCLFSDGDIQKSIQQDELKIEPFTPDNLTPNGLDLTIGEVYLKQKDQRIQEGTARIPPGTWFAVSTAEVITLGPKMAAQLWIRSSYARRGAIAGFGKVEAGFSGQLTIGAANLGDEPLELPIGDRFCQIVFESLHSIPESLYETRSGNYQGQRGVTLAPKATKTSEGET